MGSPFCTASIVDSRHLVTTASCVFEMSPSSLNVQYGTEDKNNVKFADIVKKVHIHPMYSFYAKVGFSPIPLLQVFTQLRLSGHSGLVRDFRSTLR